MKKFIAILLVITMACTLLTSCSGGNGSKKHTTSADNSTSSQNLNPAGELPIVKETVQLNCWVVPSPDWKIDNFDDNVFTKWVEEKTNIDLTFTVGPAADAKTKLSILLSSGRYPDILFSPGFSPSEQEVYGAQGLILPLNQYIDKYGVETKKIFERYPEIKEAVVRSDGKIYSLPSYSEDPHARSFSRLWIYKPFLKALNLKMPETTDELVDVLTKFKNGDPNKNNKADEIPMAGAQSYMFTDPAVFLMNSFIYFDNNKQMVIDNGTLKPVFDTQEYKEGLKYINKLFNTGLLLPQSFSQNEQALRQLIDNADAPIVGSFFTHAPFLMASEDRYPDFEMVPPLKGPKGVQYTCEYFITQTDGSVITNKCKNPEAAFRLLDFLYTQETSMRKGSGEKGVEWDFNTDTSIVNDYGNKPTWVTLSREKRPNVMWALIGNSFQPVEQSALYVYDMSPEAIEERKNGAVKLDPFVQFETAAMNVGNKYLPPKGLRLPQVFIFNQEESTMLADAELTVYNYVNQMRVKFITGTSNLDSDWEKYLSQLKALGTGEVVDMYQKAYDKLYK